MHYKHTQIGYLIIFVLVAVVILFLSILRQAGQELIFNIVAFFIIFLIASFLTLNVAVDENYIRIKFGYGIFRKDFALKEIISAKTVRNHWYYGWGIRFWFWPRMWIFNVSGFDAVEIQMKNGKRYRIGTDQPQELKNVITQAIK